jgi:hypothetical protein
MEMSSVLSQNKLITDFLLHRHRLELLDAAKKDTCFRTADLYPVNRRGVAPKEGQNRESVAVASDGS